MLCTHTDDCSEKIQKKSFLDILLNILEECPDQMTDKDIREEVDTFLFEGHDTSSLAINMTLLLLGMHTDVQVLSQITLYEYLIEGKPNPYRTEPETSCIVFLATPTETLR